MDGPVSEGADEDAAYGRPLRIAAIVIAVILVSCCAIRTLWSLYWLAV